jgi:hypothetical protein
MNSSHKKKINRSLTLILGWMLIVGGGVLGLIPFLQGWVLGLAGAIILIKTYGHEHHYVKKIINIMPKEIQKQLLKKI